MEKEIRSVIFDLGNTLHDFSLDIFIDWFAGQFGTSPHFIWDVFSKPPDGLIFPYEEGKISTKEFMLHAIERSESILRQLKGRGVMAPYMSESEFVSHLNMVWDSGPTSRRRLSLLRKLRGRGYGIYILSNLNFAHLEYIRGPVIHGRNYSRFSELLQVTHQFFASCELGCRKRKPGEATKEECEKVFRMVLSRIHADPVEVVFVDDIPGHVKVFEGMGGHGIHFRGHWTEVESRLYKLGVRWE